MEKVMEPQLGTEDVDNVDVMVAAMYTWMKESRKTSFFVTTAEGSYFINLLGGVSLSVAGFLFTKFVVPALKSKYAAVRTNRSATAFDNSPTISDAAIARMLVELQPNLRSNYMIDRRRQVSNYLSQGLYEPRRPAGGHNLLPSHINDVTIIFNMSDNVSNEAAQNFMRDLQICVHHLFMPIPARVILLRGSKLIRALFDIRLVNSEDQLQQLKAQAKELEDLAEKAMTLDENATLQIGGLTIIHKDDQGQLTMSILPETDVPIISSVTHFPGCRELMIEGCFFNGSEFKASTSSQCTNLRVFKEVKLKDGLEVVFAQAPEANELLLDDHTYIYAYKSVLCGEKSVVVRSEGELIKTSPQSSIIDELRKSDTIATIVILFVIFNMLGIAPASSFIVRFSLQLIIIAVGYLLAMLLLGPWFMKWLTSKGALDEGPVVANKGKVMEREGFERSPGVADKGKGIKGKGITQRGTIKRRVIKSFLS